MTREILTPSPIPNATVTKCFFDGGVPYYEVKPNEGYVLHDKARDCLSIATDTMEQSQKLGYTAGFVTCGINYEFTPITVTDENGVSFTAYGPREFAAVFARIMRH